MQSSELMGAYTRALCAGGRHGRQRRSVERGGYQFAVVEGVLRLVAHKRMGQAVRLKIARRSETIVIDIVPEHRGG